MIDHARGTRARPGPVRVHDAAIRRSDPAPASRRDCRFDVTAAGSSSSARRAIMSQRHRLLAGVLSLALALVLPLARAATQPAGRACHSATATAAGVVIWGGAEACGVGVVSDSSLWRWEDSVWRRLPGPPLVPREDALLVATGAPFALTLIGGRRDGIVSDDVWHFDSRSWTRPPAAGGPGPIQHGAAAFDPVRRRVVVFGGAVGRTLGRRTYEWDGSRWHAFDVPGPAPRVGHGMAWSRTDGGVLLYGGFADGRFRDLWRWDGQSWTRLSDAGPTYTEGHVVAETDSGVLVVGPGTEGADAVRAWRWHRGRFTALGEAAPPLLVGATATWDRRRGVLVYWGGAGGASGPSATVYELRGARWRARAPRDRASRPDARYGAGTRHTAPPPARRREPRAGGTASRPSPTDAGAQSARSASRLTTRSASPVSFWSVSPSSSSVVCRICASCSRPRRRA